MKEITFSLIPEGEIPAWHAWLSDIKSAMEDPAMFVVDPLSFVTAHLQNGGFGIQAIGEHGERMGCLLCCVPHEDNLGVGRFPAQPDALSRVIHMEYVAVEPQYRGHGLHTRMLREAESILRDTRFCHLFATAAPDNAASVRSFLRAGYEIVETKKLYGGLQRHVLYKAL